jgi:hypothetical protein
MNLLKLLKVYKQLPVLDSFDRAMIEIARQLLLKGRINSRKTKINP